MPGRSFVSSGSEYSYGYQGMEKESEVYGEGNLYNFGARLQDPRIVRWFSRDNVIKPYFSPYQFAANNFVNFIDPDGNDEFHFYFEARANDVSGFGAKTLHIDIIPKEGPHEFYSHQSLTTYDVKTGNVQEFTSTLRFYPLKRNGSFDMGARLNSPVGFSIKADDRIWLGMFLDATSPEVREKFAKSDQIFNQIAREGSTYNLYNDYLEPIASIATIAIGGVETFGSKSTKALSTTERLQAYVTKAANRVDMLGDAAFTAKQLKAIQRHPYLRPMFRGNRIDVMARNLMKNDSKLFHLKSNYSRGPDFEDISTGEWWDMTTEAAWRAHVRKYGPGGTHLKTN